MGSKTVDIRNRPVNAVILKSAPYREQDRLLSVFTLEEGPERVIARGAGKPDGSLRPVAQAYAQAELLLTPAKGGLSFLAEGRPVQSFLRLDSGLPRFAAAAYIAELTLAAVPERRPAPEIYGLLLAAFSLLKMDEDLGRTARFFELRLLRALGLLPELNGCGRCGARLRGAAFVLSPRAGQLLCASCGRDEAAPPLSAGAALTMLKLLELPLDKLPALKISAAIGRELEEALAHYLRYHLEYDSKVKAVLRQLQD